MDTKANCCHGRKFSSSNLLVMGLEKTLGVNAIQEGERDVCAILDRLELKYHVRYQAQFWKKGKL